MKFAQILRSRRKELKLTQQDIADVWGIKSVNVSDWERGKGMPEAGRLPALAKRLELSISELMGDAFRTATTTTSSQDARLFECDSQQSNVESGPDIRGQVPLISWVAAGAFCESPEHFAPGDAEKWLACPVPHGKYTYCLRVVGKSMDDGGEGYRDGEIIFVDPDAEAMPGKDAIVRTPNGESTFKRLKQDVDGLYLQALNPRWEPNYFKMPEGSTICGIVIFAGRER